MFDGRVPFLFFCHMSFSLLYTYEMPPFSNLEPGPESVQQIDHLEELLERFPKELQTFWENKIKGLDYKTSVDTLEKALNERSSIREKITTRYFGETNNEEIKKQLRITIDCIEGTFGDVNYFIGNGSTAEVYEMPYNNDICVKYLVDPNTKAYENTIRTESLYLEEMMGVETGHFRTPAVYFYHKSEFGECYGMERIHGLSLSAILENPEKFSKLTELKSIPADTVLNNLLEFVRKMHVRGFVHHDLNMRNIMVDENLKWYVIDFGRAKKLEIGEKENEIFDALTGADFGQVESAIKTFFSKVKHLTYA